MRKKIIRVDLFVAFTSVLCVAATLLSNYAQEKQQEEIIEEKIEEALNEQEE